jgi:beta-lactamase class A
LRSRDKAPGSGKLKCLPPGTGVKVQELVEMMVAESDNTATNMLIGLLGIDYFNGYFRRIGLRNTNLSRKMMDFKARRMGVENYTTAYEQAYLFREIYRGRRISRDVSRRCLQTLLQQHLHDRIPKRLPQGVPVAHKTGLENGVCHDAGIIFTPKGDLLICVLTGHNYRTASVAKKLIADISLDAYNYMMEN